MVINSSSQRRTLSLQRWSGSWGFNPLSVWLHIVLLTFLTRQLTHPEPSGFISQNANDICLGPAKLRGFLPRSQAELWEAGQSPLITTKCTIKKQKKTKEKEKKKKKEHYPHCFSLCLSWATLPEKREGILISLILLSRTDTMSQDAICIYLSFALFRAQSSMILPNLVLEQKSKPAGFLTQRVSNQGISG